MADALDLGFDPALSPCARNYLSADPIGSILDFFGHRAIPIVHFRPVLADSSAKVTLKSRAALLCLLRRILHPVRVLKSLILLVQTSDLGAALAELAHISEVI
jgi:hypothetical protein